MLYVVALLACLFSSLGFGAQSLVLTPGVTARYTIPDQAPWNQVGDYRFELRVHGLSFPIPANYSNVWQTGLINIRYGLQGSSDLSVVTAGVDSSNTWLPLRGRNDVLLRIQRHMALGRLTIEVWNADGRGYSQMTAPAATTVKNLAGTYSIGGANTDLKVAWARTFSSVVPVGSPPPKASETGDLADWKFKESSDANAVSLSSNTFTFADTPSLPPVAIARIASEPLDWMQDAAIVRAAKPLELNAEGSYSLSNGSGLSYSWEQVAGPTEAEWSSRTEANPVIGGLAFGEYSFRLTVTDEEGRQGVQDFIVGAVETDENDVVIHADPNINFVFGPMMRLGKSAWPWQDENHRDLSETYGRLVMSGEGVWAADWATPLPGTITASPRNRVITGMGTSFQSDFCGGPGNTKPATSFSVIVLGSGANSYPAAIAECTSDTQILLAPGEESSAPALADAPYSRTLNGYWWGGAWNGAGGANNANYYDNVMAHYALYYRTGLTRYRDYARALADRWYDSPFFLRAPFPRMWSLGGVLWRAYEGRLYHWWEQKLNPALDTMALQVGQSTQINDLREEAYRLAYVAIAGRLTEDSSRADRYKQAIITAAKRRWAPSRNSEGYWLSNSYGYASWNGKVGRVNVSTGSTSVIGVGTTSSDSHPNSGWNSTRVGNCFFIPGDAEAYSVQAVLSSTELILDRPYAGPNRERSEWQVSNLCGTGVQPFMLGIAMTAWGYGYELTSEPEMREFSVQAANWVLDKGVQKSTKGLYYGRVYPNCEPPTEDNGNCAYDSRSAARVEASRFLNGEVLGALAHAYSQDPKPAMRGDIDRLFGAVFGKRSGPETDSIYTTLLSVSTNGCCPKNFGFFYGFGKSWSWPAVRANRKEE
jgi:hypothetical protein